MLVFLLMSQVYSKCAFSVIKKDGKDYPIELDEKDSEPFLLTNVQTPCPQYLNQMVCCNALQEGQMQSNFQAIDGAFGSPGGCDVCGANLKRFWCDYTCNPKQRDFVKTNGYQKIVDPLNPGSIVDAQLVEITVGPTTACNLWQSCKRTAFASQVTAMQSASGFFNFQGQNAVSQAGQYVSVSFAETDQALTYDSVDKCDATYPTGVTAQGFKISDTCGCNVCDLACDAVTIKYEPTGVMEGFNSWLVLSVWVGAILLAAGITLARRIMKKKDFVELI